jgi:hypothetical protein
MTRHCLALIDVFSSIPGFRQSKGKRYPLKAILAMAAAAMLCGYRSYDDPPPTALGCTFTVTVNDTQAPTITCPANVTVVGTPGQPGVVVNYDPPTVSDNCPMAMTACLPASGSTFPIGVTTVTCTATDMSGNTATCSFTITEFDLCLQDDSNPGVVFLGNSVTGDYRFCCNGTIFTGQATVIRKGSVVTFEHNAADRRLVARVDGAIFRGTASIQSPPGTIRCTITDRDTRNNTCACAPLSDIVLRR